ncbi:MAG: hypothetical protein ACLRWF_01130 [Ruthenibacterium sp.]
MENQNQGNHKSRPGLAARAGTFAKKVLTNPLTYVLLAAILFRIVYFHTLRPYSKRPIPPHTKTLAIF